ncbi:MAG: hypothetical protein V3V41_10695 [Candidatus Heimdallarchaeota archaeon]
MTKYYFDRAELDAQLAILDKYQQGSDEYRTLGQKIVASFCKPLRLTEKGINHGLELYDKWKDGGELERKELFALYILGAEALLLTRGANAHEITSKVYKEMYGKYKPEITYLTKFIYEVLYPEDYLEANPNYEKHHQEGIEAYIENRPVLRTIFIDIKLLDFGEKK